jgi:hypothetical protein
VAPLVKYSYDPTVLADGDRLDQAAHCRLSIHVFNDECIPEIAKHATKHAVAFSENEVLA